MDAIRDRTLVGSTDLDLDAVKRPSRSVCSTRVMFVPVFRTSTSTPGSTPPLASMTTPSMLAVVICV